MRNDLVLGQPTDWVAFFARVLTRVDALGSGEVDINDAKARRLPARAPRGPRARGLKGPLLGAINGTFGLGIDQLNDSSRPRTAASCRRGAGLERRSAHRFEGTISTAARSRVPARSQA